MVTDVTKFSLDVLGRYVCNDMAEVNGAVAGTDSRPFDVIVVGGGSFASIFAQHLMTADKGRRHRILVLEAGPMVVGEHVQNLPMIGLEVPPAPDPPRRPPAGIATDPEREVWGQAWHSDIAFVGLAYCLGGRSLYWGGWSPELLADELQDWPPQVVTDLTPAGSDYFGAAAEQLGTDATNDFIYGPLQTALRRVLADEAVAGNLGTAVPLNQMPNTRAASALGANPSAQALATLLGLPGPGGRTAAQLLDEAKLEAPLAVQTRARSGFFANNKFSGTPLWVSAARTAWGEWPREDNLRRRLMIVPNCHVTRLVTSGGNVTTVQTNKGDVAVVDGAVVVIAASTIESTRLALNAFQGQAGAQAIGRGLMAHLRSNLTIRIPRTSLPNNPPQSELSEAALFLKGKVNVDNKDRFFHLQITAAGLGPQGNNSEAELWRKVVDIDTLHRFTTASDSHIVITIRGIGEMDPDNPNSSITQHAEPDEYQVPRASVRLQPSARDDKLWKEMDLCSDLVALAFANGNPYEVLVNPRNNTWKTVGAGKPAVDVLPLGPPRRDGLGTTHHEAGPLRLGTNANNSAVDLNGRFHAAANLYALGPAVFPRLGSPNPMLTGTALARRLADHIAAQPAPQPSGQAAGPLPFAAGDGYSVLFDGIDNSQWRLAGDCAFPLVDGALVSEPGNDLGMSWCVTPTPADFSLRLQFRLSRPDDNSGVFLRFPDPNSKGYQNTAYVPVDFGVEVQIDDLARWDGADNHRTGAVYGLNNPNYQQATCNPPGQWNDLQVDVQGQTYTVTLNGVQSTVVNNVDGNRGLPSQPGSPAFIGLQSHSGRVAFRHIRIKAL
ncbi:family 16 glycoside hydrolase [Geodermatophilus sabuli]|uniref:family 16 glycoside hydrolase n=1 Tax=Geodermatophilus sabuli TaxID=1564158 RepID=UPI0015587968|nr:family 16 glycoside hydrolase [Geodermatophilus sabuli]MBB3082486.1 choline dehydrogenase-like flavoprotein [Geodermatophilus sabuli]